MKKASILFLVMTTASQISYGQDKSNLLGQINTITTAVPFLIISPEARAGGMGDAGVASSADANSIHWNPAKLAFIDKKTGFSISYTPWLRNLVPDINLAYLSGYHKLKNDQTIAASLRYFSLGNITFTDANGVVTGDYNPSEFAIDAAYARKLGEEFSAGLALRYIHSNLTGGVDLTGGIGTKAGNSVAADISFFFTRDTRVLKKDAVFSFGVNVSNIGAKISYTETGTKDFIPINLRLGPSLKFILNEFNTITILCDFNKLLVPTPPVYDPDSSSSGNNVILAGKDPNKSVPAGMFGSFTDAPNGFQEEMAEVVYCGGLEYWYDNLFAFRAGFFHESELKGNRKYFTLGAGLRYNVFGIDFAYLIPTEQRNPLENTLRFSLLFNFDGVKSSKKDSGE
jgi:hypothetical protein